MPIEDLLAGKGKLQQQKQAERERRLEQKAQELRQVNLPNHRCIFLILSKFEEYEHRDFQLLHLPNL